MFVYFVPSGVAGVPAELAYAFEQSPATREVLRDGPDGGRGRLLCADSDYLAKYKSDKHVWRQIPGSTCWFGHNPEQLPTTDDLARAQQISGRRVTIEWTDLEWIVPLARTLVESSDGMRWVVLLPQKLDLDASGSWVFAGVRPRFQRLFEIASAWYDLWATSQDRDGDRVVLEVDAVQAADQACEVLSYNYRVGRLELIALGVTGSEFWQPILDATIDMGGIIERINQRLAVDEGEPQKKSSIGQASAA